MLSKRLILIAFAPLMLASCGGTPQQFAVQFHTTPTAVLDSEGNQYNGFQTAVDGIEKSRKINKKVFTAKNQNNKTFSCIGFINRSKDKTLLSDVTFPGTNDSQLLIYICFENALISDTYTVYANNTQLSSGAQVIKL